MEYQLSMTLQFILEHGDNYLDGTFSDSERTLKSGMALGMPSDSVIDIVIREKRRTINRSKIGHGAQFLSEVILPQKSCSYSFRNSFFKFLIVTLTYITYCGFHLSRKPISVVKTVLHVEKDPTKIFPKTQVEPGWAPFNAENGQALFSGLDSVYLFAYAFGMFVSGHLAERFDLRYFIFIGATLSAIFTAAFGCGFYLNVHVYWFYFAVQLIGGFFQSSGWPAVVTCLGNWCGKKNRGFVMGIWNSHVSVGNILGSIIAGMWVESQWGLSFIVPAVILASIAIIDLFFLVPFPEYVGCQDSRDAKEKDEDFIGRKPWRSSSESQLAVGVGGSPSKGAPPNSGATSLLSVASAGNFSEEQKESLLPNCPRSSSPIGKESLDSVASHPPVSFKEALRIPGVVTYSLCLFFNKLVSYTFLFWLPVYIQHSGNVSPQESANLSTLFDFGGIIGCMIAGAVTDYTGERSSVCAAMLAWAAPALYMYLCYGSMYPTPLLFICGVLVNGPYGLITTAVAADLGTHPSLGGNSRALATVTSIIDGTGSVGAALGPLMAGVVSSYVSWPAVLYVLIFADILAFLFLSKKSFIKCWR
ncbi:glucose-6-phosphate exchanger SLC37A2-like isoform X2 [Convolutriloba macropyga]|uniref:glucose-6-phosphate exchanger SLC37A2-like isoform X2 n=1 Tax=Convolutriloba macropyga TaxID=536237 RepID=UPI003F527C2B